MAARRERDPVGNDVGEERDCEPEEWGLGEVDPQREGGVGHGPVSLALSTDEPVQRATRRNVATVTISVRNVETISATARPSP
jgi:hypothetical protein